ncbi:MAG: cytochrome c [Candidatus Eremiobacteraeota bacterium]|nr:cytochrome c [Candidatus Eremiobacteraeota bacterium]
MVRYSVFITLALALGFAVGCSRPQSASLQSAPSAPPSADAALANGRAIFRTGKDADGVRIAAATPPLFGNCAACHGSSGAGGMHLPGAVSADLRYKALVADPKVPYTIDTVERAIATGIDNNGAKLNPIMPRWKLSKRDLHDVAYYVLTELK